MWLFEQPQWQLHKGLLPGIEPRTFWSKSRRANHSAILLPNNVKETHVKDIENNHSNFIIAFKQIKVLFFYILIIFFFNVYTCFQEIN